MRITVKSWLRDWLASKEGTAAASSLKAYSQAVREFLEFLGPQGQRRPLESITERDIERFIRGLVESGRSPVTVNKLVRKFLSADDKDKLNNRVLSRNIAAFKLRTRPVYLAFDQDQFTNPSVRSGVIRGAIMIKVQGGLPFQLEWPPEFKGLDDFLGKAVGPRSLRPALHG